MPGSKGEAMTTLSIHRQIGGWCLDVRETKAFRTIYDRIYETSSESVVKVEFEAIDSRPDPITRTWNRIVAKHMLRTIYLPGEKDLDHD
jgi:hypothetical protein